MHDAKTTQELPAIDYLPEIEIEPHHNMCNSYWDRCDINRTQELPAVED